MSHSEIRNVRLEEQIRSVLNEILLLEVKDPRLESVTVSAVQLTGDRSMARVYFSVIGDEEREREASDGFAAAGPFLKGELGKKIRLRAVPELEFQRDSSFEYGDRMERVLDRMADEGLLPEDGPEEDDR